MDYAQIMILLKHKPNSLREKIKSRCLKCVINNQLSYFGFHETYQSIHLEYLDSSRISSGLSSPSRQDEIAFYSFF